MAKKNIHVLAHISGVTCSGKSTLAEALQDTLPQALVIDMDILEEEIQKSMYHWAGDSEVRRKARHTAVGLAVRYYRKVAALQSAVDKSNKPVILIGHHYEDDYVLVFETKNRWSLKADTQEAAKRLSVRTGIRFELAYGQIQSEEMVYESLGYTEVTDTQVYKKLKKLLRGEQR